MEIGSRLKEAREAKGLSLDDIQKETKIQTRYLQAIEKGNFQIMPGKFYTRAFIRQYAEAVGLDAEALMEEHTSELPSSSDEEYVQYTRVQKHKDQESNKTSAMASVFPKLIIGLLIVGIIAVAVFFYQQTMNNDNSGAETDDSGAGEQVTYEKNEESSADKGNGGDNPSNEGADDSEEDSAKKEQDANNDKSSEEDNKEDEQQTNDKDKKEEEKKKDESDSEKSLQLVEKGSGNVPQHTYELTNPDNINISFEAAGNNAKSYLEVKNGKGKAFYQQELNSNNSPKEFDLSDEKEIYIKVGNAPDLTMKVNGQKVDYPVDANKTVFQKFVVKVTKSSE
ncbi:helix-turn-helix domain-containing protein [Pontibacillus salicampi]|uniref:Helix-turn-helix domain-containing protein n=1 Tax=Pontibacillus salicampi TaxID=1449801 RepID=A0ABV6LP88_9BACI